MRLIFQSIFLISATCIFCLNSYASELQGPQSIGLKQGVEIFQARSDSRSYAAADFEDGYPWRGLLIGADHSTENIHHDNIYISINGGPIVYQTTIPARKEGNLLPDEGLLWHFYTRDNTEITVYASSSYVNGVSSDLSQPFPLYFSYPQPADCTDQTVPVPVAGVDQIVNVGELVTLDGSGSYDEYGPDNEDMAFYWECYSAPEVSVSLSDEGRAAVTTFIPNAEGNYYFRLSLRDKKDGENFNRSPIAYVRVSAEADMASIPYINANAGRTRQAGVGELITLDGSQSQGSNPITSYTWVQENPPGLEDIQDMAALLGTTSCQGGGCYRSNFDADNEVDGMDLAILALNYTGVDLPDQAVVQFTPGIARPHIFRLTVSDGNQTDSETTIVGVNHENAAPVLTHPPVDSACFD